MTWRVRGVVLEVVDGDSVRLDLDLGWRVWLRGELSRLDGIDAPELPTDAGKAAREFLRVLLPVGSVVWVTGARRDKFGRVLVRLELDGRDVATLLIANGHGVEYHGGAR